MLPDRSRSALSAAVLLEASVTGWTSQYMSLESQSGLERRCGGGADRPEHCQPEPPSSQAKPTARAALQVVRWSDSWQQH